MIVLCGVCKRRLDDEFRSTICPHDTFPANDGNNNFQHHPESYLESKEFGITIQNFQKRVEAWVLLALRDQAYNKKVRAARFLEEAVEAAQASDLKYHDAILILNQVYQRPPRQLSQELGGCLTTLCALASSAHENLEAVSLKEIERMETPEIIEKVQLRQKSKVNPK